MKHLWLAAVALLVSGCASNNEPFKSPQAATTPGPAAEAPVAAADTAFPADVRQALAAAEAAARKADSVGFQWRDTEKSIKEAREAAQKSDYATAVKLAKRAEREGNLAYAQYEQQQKSVAKR